MKENYKMTTNNLPADTLLLDLQPTRFIKVQDLTERWNTKEIIVTIHSVQRETVEPKPGHKEMQPVLYFRTKGGSVYPQGFLLAARVNVTNLAEATGARTIGEAIGKKIKIYVDTHRNQDVLRISAEPVDPPEDLKE